MAHDDHDHGHDHRGERPHDAASWDEMYRGSDRIWSGKPNQALVDEIEGVSPGRALDLACGEGADAVWLTERGWDVTAVDISAVAIDRARAAAAERGLEIDWQVADFVEAPPRESVDLVTAFYASIPVEARASAIAALTGSVAPGGLLLVVHHDFSGTDEPPFDPADYMGVSDVAAALGPEWDIEFHGTRERETPEGRSPHAPDEVLRARRRS